MERRGSRERGGSRQAGKRGIENQGRRPFLMWCPGISKDDGCQSEGNHKSLSLPQVWSDLPEQKTSRLEM